MCAPSHRILTLNTFLDQYIYSIRSPQRPGAGETVPFLQRPQMVRHLSTSNSRSQKRSEVAVMRDTIPNNFLQQVIQVNIDSCPLTSAFMSTSHYSPPCVFSVLPRCDPSSCNETGQERNRYTGRRPRRCFPGTAHGSCRIWPEGRVTR